MTIVHAYAAEIVKSERNAAGNLVVYGKATGPDLDLDGQICDPSWLKQAMPAWMTWGNVREMHQPISAGVGIELEEIGDDWWLKSECIDPSTAAKIEAGALKGYSIGIKNPKVIKDAGAPGGRIVGGAIVETSYVDRPCNPTAKLVLAKAAKDGTLQPVEAPDEAAEAIDVLTRAEVELATGVDTATKALGVDLLRRLRKLAPEITNKAATPAEDIAGVRAAIAAIARVIESEAQGLADGMAYEAYQIRCLLDAVASLEWFCEMEQNEAVVEALDASGAVEIDLGAEADATKTTDAGQAPDNSTVADMITKAVTEAGKASEERIKTLEAQLAKVASTPIPGGPVLARPVQNIAAAEGRVSALAKAAEYDRRAAELRGIDHHAAEGYAELARAERAKVAQ